MPSKTGDPGGGGRSRKATLHVPVHLPRLFYCKGPQPQAACVPSLPARRGVQGGGPPGSSCSSPTIKGNLGPSKSCGMFFVICRTFALPRQSSVQNRRFRGAGEGSCACQRRRQEEEGKGSQLKLQFTGTEPFPLHRSPRESCPREDAPAAQAGSPGGAQRARPREAEAGFAEVSPVAYPGFPRERGNLPQGLQT